MKWVAGMILAGVLLLIWCAAWGQDGHAQHHDMYKDWKRPDCSSAPFSLGSCSCCSGDERSGDCRPTHGSPRDDGNGWDVWVGPGRDDYAHALPRTLLPRTPDGRCHVCARGFSVLCFVPCDPRS